MVLPELSRQRLRVQSSRRLALPQYPLTASCWTGWAQEAARGDAVVVGGFCERGEGGRLFNSAAVVDRSGVLTVYRKLHLWNDESPVVHARQ